MRDRIELTDIYKGAYLLSKGAELLEVKHDEERLGRDLVSFEIEGENIYDQLIAYEQGEAVVNPLKLRQMVNLLRDLVFQKVRAKELDPPIKSEDDKVEVRMKA